MDRLSGKVALITGGTSGMGAEAAKLFAREGATVVVTGSTPATVERARTDLAGVEVVASDASDHAAIQSLVAETARKHGRIDVLFANAGMARYLPYGQVDEAFFDRMFALNTRGAFFLVQEVARVMPDGGAIVLTSSNAHAQGMENLSVYAASKAALRSLGRSFAAELAPRRIRVNTISPGPVRTPIWEKATGMTAEQLAGMEQQIGARIPLKRVGQPSEVAYAALFLASDEASFTTGADFPVDGGILDLGYVQ